MGRTDGEERTLGCSHLHTLHPTAGEGRGGTERDIFRVKDGSAEPGPAGLICMMSPGKYLLTPTESAWDTLTLKQLTQLSANSQRHRWDAMATCSRLLGLSFLF